MGYADDPSFRACGFADPNSPRAPPAKPKRSSLRFSLRAAKKKLSRAEEMATATGWLWKRGSGKGALGLKNWKRRWFVLEYPLLHYYRNPGDATPRGTVNCEQVTLSETAGMERTGREHCFMVHHPARKIYFLQAEDEADMMSWVKASRNERKVGLIDFEEISMIGKGNFGLVKLVRRKASQKLYAMKVLAKDNLLFKGKNSVSQAITEKEVLQEMSARPHPYVVSLRYAFQDARHLFLLLDYVGGGDLFNLLLKLLLHRLRNVSRSIRCGIQVLIGHHCVNLSLIHI